MTAVELSPLHIQRQTTLLNTALIALIVLFLLLKAHFLFLQNINWDEFLFLSKVHEAIRGELGQVLQTAHIHAFIWLQKVPGNEIEQILAARLVMLALQTATVVFICLIGRRLFGTTEGLLSALIYLTFTFNFDHGTSFRADPIAVLLIMGALWLLLRDKHQVAEIFGAATLIALSGIITIKSIFYVPTLAMAVLCLRGQQFSANNVHQLLILGAVSILLFVGLYLLHDTLAVNNVDYSATERIGSNVNTVFSAGFIPRAFHLLVSFWYNAVEWFIMIAGLVLAIAALATTKASRHAIGVIALILPLTTVLFYRNAFPYYYVFILAAPVLFAGVLAKGLKENYAEQSPLKFHAAIAIVAVLLLGKTLIHAYQNNNDEIVAQRQLIDMVHRIFPEPVPYIDRSSMISTYRKQGIFMSTWGVEGYKAAGEPIMEELIRRTQPLFLLENSPGLMLEDPYNLTAYHLLPEDAAILRDNYIPHWGAIRVLGKQIDLTQTGESYNAEILVPGIYTVEATAPIRINGALYNPGDFINLSAGYHSFESENTALSVTLRWGEDLYQPTETPSEQVLFTTLV